MITTIGQIFFALSILGILFLLLRKIPAILKYPRHSTKEISDNGVLREQWNKIQERTGLSEFFHKVFFPKMEKFLRRLKIVLLKLDNFLARRVEKLREKTKRRKKEI